ncbi:MAG: hypothetical protein HC902_14710 [Calothrix sp. SM1_5_4]|nr:hypothetical protein [Calothrix sp. SM1_5_4]
MTRQVLKANPTGRVQLNQEGGGLGIVDSLDYFRSMIANGFSKSAADNYIDEKLLQEQMAGYGPNFATSYGNAMQRGGALYSSERMFGMDSTQVSGSRMQMVGVPLDRLQVGMQFMSQYMGRLPTNLRDASMLNFQNNFGLSDGAAGQMFRGGAMDPGIFNRMRLEYARSGLGGPLTDMATTSVTDAAMGYASRFDAAGMSGAASRSLPASRPLLAHCQGCPRLNRRGTATKSQTPVSPI